MAKPDWPRRGSFSSFQESRKAAIPTHCSPTNTYYLKPPSNSRRKQPEECGLERASLRMGTRKRHTLGKSDRHSGNAFCAEPVKCTRRIYSSISPRWAFPSKQLCSSEERASIHCSKEMVQLQCRTTYQQALFRSLEVAYGSFMFQIH